MSNLLTVKRNAITDLIRQYLCQAISASEFAEKYLILWRDFRDELWNTISPEQRLVSDDLVKMRLTKQISAEEFERQYKAIWGDAVINEENTAIDAIHTACYEFDKNNLPTRSEDDLIATINKWRPKILLADND